MYILTLFYVYLITKLFLHCIYIVFLPSTSVLSPNLRWGGVERSILQLSVNFNCLVLNWRIRVMDLYTSICSLLSQIPPLKPIFTLFLDDKKEARNIMRNLKDWYIEPDSKVPFFLSVWSFIRLSVLSTSLRPFFSTPEKWGTHPVDRLITSFVLIRAYSEIRFGGRELFLVRRRLQVSIGRPRTYPVSSPDNNDIVGDRSREDWTDLYPPCREGVQREVRSRSGVPRFYPILYLSSNPVLSTPPREIP